MGSISSLQVPVREITVGIYQIDTLRHGLLSPSGVYLALLILVNTL